MHERRFNGETDRLRSPERLKLLEVERVVELSLKDINIESVLDIGTGSGVFAEAFFNKNLKVTGVDAEDRMIERASEIVPGVDFKKSIAEKLPFEKDSFDLVFMGLLLHEADDQTKTLSEAKRVAKKRIAILEWPYTETEIGPPLEHRIKPEALNKMADKAELKGLKTIELNSLNLHLFDI